LAKNFRKRTVKNFMDLLILSEASKEPISGCGVISKISQSFGFLVSSGTVYSTLYSMEREGLVKASWAGRKRVYRITEEGEEFLVAAKKEANFLSTLL
jgi:DNA-binding PadR family transcriptional regulator